MTAVSRLREDERGFSLIELLAGLAISSVVLTALMMTFLTGLRGVGNVQDRVDASSRGRLAMDRITSLMDSQVCVSAKNAVTGIDEAVAPIVPGSDGNSVTFYGDLNGASTTPNKYQISYSPAAKTLTLSTWTPQGALPTVTYPGVPKVVQLADFIVPSRNGAGVQQPIFQYYPFIDHDGFSDDGTVSATPVAVSDQVAANTIVRVTVNFTAISSRTKVEDPRMAALSGEVSAASYDPQNKAVCP
jgi:prepilin-type N-terminal cleavage/methylation domain-containing protein